MYFALFHSHLLLLFRRVCVFLWPLNYLGSLLLLLFSSFVLISICLSPGCCLQHAPAHAFDSFSQFYLFSFSFSTQQHVAGWPDSQLTYDLVACYNCFSCGPATVVVGPGAGATATSTWAQSSTALRCNFLEICAHFGISFSCALLWVWVEFFYFGFTATGSCDIVWPWA